MSTTAKGAFANAIFVALKGDSTLCDLVGGSAAARIYDDAPRAERVEFPYIVVGDRAADDEVGGMQLTTVKARVTLHVWSAARGAAQAEAIQARIASVLSQNRVLVLVDGYAQIGGSLVCENALCFADRDEDMPDKSLYHGVQQFTADIEGAIP